MSIDWSAEIEKVAVLPVPDWAWAMTSRPRMMGMIARCWIADGFSKSINGQRVLANGYTDDGTQDKVGPYSLYA